MKKKSPKKPKEPSSSSPRWWRSRQVLLVSAAWLLLPNISGVFIEQMVIQPALSFSRQQLQQQVQQNTQRTLQLALNSLPEQLKTLTAAAYLNDALLSTSDLSLLQQQLAALLPAGSQVQLLRAGQPLEHKDDYVLLNLINQLEKGEQPPPQILKQPAGLIYRAGIELKNSDVGLGFLIVSIPLQPFIAALPKLDSSLGYLEVALQIAGVKMLPVYNTGNSKLKTIITPEKITIAQVPLSIFLQVDAETARHQVPDSLFWIFINTASLLSLGFWLTLRHREQRLLANDLRKLNHHLSPNNNTRASHYHAAHFQTIEDQIIQLLTSAESNANLSCHPEQVNAKSLFLKTASSIKIDGEEAIFDLDLNLEDKTVFDMSAAVPEIQALPASIFRQYDIRGIVDDTLTPQLVSAIGQALGTQSLKKKQSTIVIGRDGRHSSPMLSQALAQGIMQSGCNVLDIGEVPTPLVYFATYHTEFKSGVMITGSHNPPEYNGLKMVLAGETLFGQHILDLKNLIEQQQLAQGQGKYSTLDISEDYLQRATQDTVLARRLKVVVDAGNGVAGPTALALLDRLGCDVIPLYCDIDGDFPNHHPDPSKPENLHTLIETVKTQQADLGIAFDGDGDRLGVVTSSGRLIYPDRLLMYFAKDILVQHPGGDIIFDVKCTSSLNRMISQWGGRPIMWKTGHSLIKAKLKETGALIAGEMSGHIFFNDRWFGFDDALYSAARLLELVSMSAQSLDEAMNEIPELVSTPEINITVAEDNKFKIIETLKSVGAFSSGKVTTLDGIRVDYPHGWGLIRASNTTPVLVARFEAETAEEMNRIRQEFAVNLAKVDPSLKFPS